MWIEVYISHELLSKITKQRTAGGKCFLFCWGRINTLAVPSRVATTINALHPEILFLRLPSFLLLVAEQQLNDAELASGAKLTDKLLMLFAGFHFGLFWKGLEKTSKIFNATTSDPTSQQTWFSAP